MVLFFDPCHLQHNVVNGRMWQPKGKEGTIAVKSNPGRKRINILGALNLKSLRTTTILTEEKCNAERVIDLFRKIRANYPTQRIVIILDNARYNYANITRGYAKEVDIELFFLPPYSPNLNLIERLWKFVKKILVRNKYYEKYDLFVCKVRDFFENIQKYKSELKELLTEKFQIIHTD